MSVQDEDDKPTVVLDLNALKKQKLKQEEDLANLASELEFNVSPEVSGTDPEVFAENFLNQRQEVPKKEEEKEEKEEKFPVILFDYESNFFAENKSDFPEGYEYKVVKTVADLNQCLKNKKFQIVCFNYDVLPKAVNQLSAQIRAKMPFTKTIIMARAISPEKAKLHARTPSGANGYYRYPLEKEKVEKEFQKIFVKSKNG